MFKNPLKYQSGGSTPTQQQQEQLVQLFQAAAQNAQVDPEALVKKAQELGQDENAAAQFMEGLQKCAQGDPAGIQFIKSLFTSSHKRGGKIQDFICKHGKGGAVAGYGCAKSHQNGGPIVVPIVNSNKDMPMTATGRNPYRMELIPNSADLQKSIIMMQQRPMYAEGGDKLPIKAQTGLGNLGFKYLGENSYQNFNNPRQYNILSHGYEINGEEVAVPTREGAYRMGIDPETAGAYNNGGERIYSRPAFEGIRDFYENKLPQSMVLKPNSDERLAGMENGGKVEKAQPGKKLSTPVSTTPADSTNVQYTIQWPFGGKTDSVTFEDVNGNKTS